MLRVLTVSLVILICGTSSSSAQLLTFDFTGTAPGQNSPWASTSLLNSNLLITTGWSLGTVTGNTANNRFTATSWSTGSTFDDALASDDYIYFAITPASGYQIDLSNANISFTLQNSASGPDYYSVRSSIDGYASDLSAGSASLNASGGTTATSLSLPSSITFSGLTNPAQFRIYGWGATAAAGTFSVNAWSMNGVITAVPEPAAYAVLLGTLVLLAAARRRH